MPSEDESTKRTGGSHAHPSLTGRADVAMCQVVPEGGAGLSVLGSVLLMLHGVFISLSFGSLPRHKASARFFLGVLRESHHLLPLLLPMLLPIHAAPL